MIILCWTLKCLLYMFIEGTQIILKMYDSCKLIRSPFVTCNQHLYKSPSHLFPGTRHCHRTTPTRHFRRQHHAVGDFRCLPGGLWEAGNEATTQCCTSLVILLLIYIYNKLEKHLIVLMIENIRDCGLVDWKHIVKCNLTVVKLFEHLA